MLGLPSQNSQRTKAFHYEGTKDIERAGIRDKCFFVVGVGSRDLTSMVEYSILCGQLRIKSGRISVAGKPPGGLKLRGFYHNLFRSKSLQNVFQKTPNFEEFSRI